MRELLATSALALLLAAGCASPLRSAPVPAPSDVSPGVEATALSPTDTNTEASIQWLREHASPLRSFDPADEDFGDLEPIRRAIGDARVAFLGEPSHGTGNIFSGQTRLVKFLHQQMGFDVLVFESGFFDMTKVWEAIRRGDPPSDAFRQGIFRVWTEPAEMHPLAEYLAEHANGPRPLELAGYDTQFSGPASYHMLVPELRAYLDSVGLFGSFAADSALWDGFRRIHWFGTPTAPADTIPPDSDTQTHFLAGVAQLREAIGARAEDEQARFWLQVLENVSVFAPIRWIQIAKPPVEDWLPGWNMRDEQGARNLLWLANERYRGRKLIVWLASIHAARNLEVIDPRDPELPYERTLPTGHHVWQALGPEMYTLGFVALEGESQIGPNTWAIEADQQPEVELEEMLGFAGFDFAFLDYRNRAPGGEWLRTPFGSRPFGNSAMVGPWPEVLDGIIFVRKGTPATWPSLTPAQQP
jgi:erythromycin esterase